MWPLTVSVESNQLKDAIYEAALRDGRALEGVERTNQWPVDRVAKGYTDAWFKEFANEVKTVKRSLRGALSTQWEIKHGLAKKNEAWDCRVYSLAAAMVEVWPQPIRDGMIRLAYREASREGSPATKERARAPSNRGCVARWV